MVAIAAGRYRAGSNAHYPEERPERDVEVARFAIDRTPVTNAQFAEFVAATGYVTVAERASPAGSAVFRMTEGPVDLHDPSSWWRFCDRACWKHPEGEGSRIEGREGHPVVHVAFADAAAYAGWKGRRLPDEHEWEAAARAAATTTYAWGEEFAPGGALMANVWTGAFPWYFSRGEKPGTSAVASYPPNAFGLHDMIGNVWEWTRTPMHAPKPCGCLPPAVDAAAASSGAALVLKGGSWLCAGEYCARYRPAARIALTAESTTGHVGFRCAADL
ncbi:MAG TPA: SUMF1/EgtB/PvdO family nonheme iron enzyme [Candidatus Binatia bacterium]|jgi:formylglycine-generating enzyme required for sulfatase activity